MQNLVAICRRTTVGDGKARSFFVSQSVCLYVTLRLERDYQTQVHSLKELYCRQLFVDFDEAFSIFRG